MSPAPYKKCLAQLEAKEQHALKCSSNKRQLHPLKLNVKAQSIFDRKKNTHNMKFYLLPILNDKRILQSNNFHNI